MTPLFAPKPAPRGIGFGPGYGDQAQAGPGGWNPGGGYGLGKDGSWTSPAWPRPGPAWPAPAFPVLPTPQSYGWGARGAQGPYAAMPGSGPFGQGFGGFDPYTQQQIASAGFSQPWGGFAR